MAKSSTPSPIDDLTFDVITVLQNKAKALEAYDKYLSDAEDEDDDELKEVFTEMRKQDEEHVLVLKESLARRLDEDLGYSDEEEEVDDEDEDFDEEDEEEVEVQAPAVEPEAAAAETENGGTATPAPSRRGEPTSRHR